MEDLILIMIVLIKSDKDFGSGKIMSWIFVKNPMQYKVLHMKFELTKIRICISVQVMTYLEIGLNLENVVITNIQCENWLYHTLDGAFLPDLMKYETTQSL